MNTPVRVLLVEDSPDDAELLLRELRRRGYEPSHRRIDSAQALVEALDSQEWDVILCDYTMRGFTGTQALSLVRSRGLDVPFIFVSGTIGEETAVAAMKAGAHDYVVKDNLTRLVPAIERELREAEVRRDRARAEARRHAAEARFQEILVMAPDAIVAMDEDHRITIFNRAAETLFGYRTEEVSGQFLDLLLPSRFAAGHRAHVAEFARSPVSARRMNERGEVTGRRKNGEEFPAEASISKIVENGRTTFMAVVRDITQRKLLEDQLRQAQKMEAVGQLTGGLAHDFNNLLTVVIGNLDILREERASDPKVQEFAQLALGASMRGADLTRQLLAYSRRQTLETKAFDLNRLVADMMELLRRTLGEHIDVETSLDEGLWPAFADPTQVETALANLAINARDAMPDGGRLTIETANKHLDEDYAAANVDVSPGEYVMLAVSDTGSGIAPEILKRVFEPFFTTKELGKGTGLGLSMVYGFAKQSGGHVNIYSEVGHGTTVRLYLPRAAAGLDVEAAEDMPDLGGNAQDALILVVEDDPDVRSVAVLQLDSLGYRVLEAENGETALELLGQNPSIDLLFTDVVLRGGMSGIDLAQEARKIRPSLKVLFVSGYAEGAMADDSRVGRADPTLSKPYRMRDLDRKVQEVLSGKRS
jgi:PAS domain S-box-containing protein